MTLGGVSRAIRWLGAVAASYLWQEGCIALAALSVWFWHGEYVERVKLDAALADIADDQERILAMQHADELAGEAAIEAARRCKGQT